MQSKKDSESKRVNFDNERKTEFDKKYEMRDKKGYKSDDSTKKSRNKRGKPKSKSGKDEYVKDSRKQGSNEISWYSKNPELVKAACSYPFNPITGRRVLGVSSTIPTILTLKYQPMYTDEQVGNGANAFTQAFNSMYSFLVHANSRNYVYDPVDLGLMILSGIEVFEAIAHGIRAYGIARYYTEHSATMPDSLIRAAGFDPNSIKSNLGKVWFDLNLLIDKTRQIWIPNTMPLLDRRIWMALNYFADAESAAAQVYSYRRTQFFKYKTGVTAEGFRGLVPVPAVIVFTGVSWDKYVEMVNDMIDSLINEEDRGIIFGDILKAYGTENIFALKPIDSNYAIAPIYNTEVLTQFENSTKCNSCKIQGWVANNDGTIYPILDNNFQTEARKKAKYWCPAKGILNFHQKEQPTPEQLMVATRATTLGLVSARCYSTAHIQSDTTYPLTLPLQMGLNFPEAFGTELVQDWELDGRSMDEYLTTKTTGNMEFTTYDADFMSFDWNPFIYSFNDDVIAVGNIDAVKAIGDYDNFAVIDPVVLKKMHRVAAFSLLGVPQV